MVWEYRHGPDPIQHRAGTSPPRPLSVGDEVHFDVGDPLTVVGTTDTLLLFDGRWELRPMWRHPIEGDFTWVRT